jgi:hypothetical protein
MIKKHGTPDPESEEAKYYGPDSPKHCSYCDPSEVNNDDMLEYLINKSGQTKEQIKATILKEREDV